MKKNTNACIFIFVSLFLFLRGVAPAVLLNREECALQEALYWETDGDVVIQRDLACDLKDTTEVLELAHRLLEGPSADNEAWAGEILLSTDRKISRENLVRQTVASLVFPSFKGDDTSDSNRIVRGIWMGKYWSLGSSSRAIRLKTVVDSKSYPVFQLSNVGLKKFKGYFLGTPAEADIALLKSAITDYLSHGASPLISNDIDAGFVLRLYLQHTEDEELVATLLSNRTTNVHLTMEMLTTLTYFDMGDSDYTPQLVACFEGMAYSDDYANVRDIDGALLAAMSQHFESVGVQRAIKKAMFVNPGYYFDKMQNFPLLPSEEFIVGKNSGDRDWELNVENWQLHVEKAQKNMQHLEDLGNEE